MAGIYRLRGLDGGARFHSPTPDPLRPPSSGLPQHSGLRTRISRVTDRGKGILYVLGAALLWSTGGIGIKAVDEPPLVVSFYRCLFAAIALLILLRQRAWTRRWKSTPVFIFAIISYGLCLITFVVATKWTTAANAIFLQYAGAVWVLILSPLVLHEPIRSRDVIAIAAAICGMALFFVGRFESHGMAGNLMALISSVFFAGLIMSLRREQAAGEAAVTWGNIFGAAVVLPLVASNLRVTSPSLAVLLFLGVFQIALAYVLFIRGLKHVAATQASLTGMLEPVMNPIWVLLLIGERPSLYAVCGGIVVLAAIAWHTLGGESAPDLPAVD
jgi:drug/metabolite transporter, DME family